VNNIRAWLERAIALEQRGDYAAARGLYEQVLAEAPEHPGALLKTALFEQAAGDLASARAKLARALRAAQKAELSTAPIRLAIAGLAERANDPAAARAAYDQVLAEVPRHPAATFGLGQLALQEGDAKAAEARFRDVIAMHSDNVAARAQLANALLAQGAADLAATELAPALASAPQSVPLRHLAATVALLQGDAIAAAAHCRAGLAVAPAHAGLLTTLGHALRASGTLAAAAEAFGAAASATPGDAAAWLARRELFARTVTLKVRYSDFTTITRSHTEPATRDEESIVRRAVALLDRTDAGRRPVRLLGVSVHNLTTNEHTTEEPQGRLPFDS